MKLAKLEILISMVVISWSSLLLADTNTAATPWQGQWYNITPNRAGVTEAYCIAHSLDNYQTTFAMINKEDLRASDVF